MQSSGDHSISFCHISNQSDTFMTFYPIHFGHLVSYQESSAVATKPRDIFVRLIRQCLIFRPF